MQESTIQIQLPRSLLAFGLRAEEVQERITEWLTLSLFTEGRISSGKAAALLGITRIEFLSLLRRRGIAFIDFTPEEIAEELGAAGEIQTIP